MKQRNILLLLVASGTVILLAVVYVLWQFVNPHTVGQRTDFIQTVSGVIGGAAVLTGLYFTWRGQVTTQQNLARTQAATKRQLKNAKEELQLTREGQITDRFTQAIDQLGKTDDKENRVQEIRLGGIYALERIAIEVPDQYHWPIMQVFAAYLRRYSSWQGDPLKVVDPAADIQTVLNVIGRRSRYFETGEDEPLLLSDTDFSNYTFPANAHLEGALLTQAHLENATLPQAQLKKADLRGAHLEGANLQGADLTDADLRGAHLEGAHLRNADLTGADLRNAYLTATYLPGAKLPEAKKVDPESLDEANGAFNTKVGELPQPTWWGGLPGNDAILEPGEWSIKVWKSLLHFSSLGEGWYSLLFMPYIFVLSPAGVSFAGEGINFFSGPWVCDENKPKETNALIPAPKNIVAWFDNHPYVTPVTQPQGWKNSCGGASGVQFYVEVDPDTPDHELGMSAEGPGVPIFPAFIRSDSYFLSKGKKNRVIVLERDDECTVIIVESPPDEFVEFNDRVEEEVLANLHWSVQS